MRILFLASEVAPFSKTGGLGDVAGALPRALAALGHEVLVVSPLYASVPREGLQRLERVFALNFAFGQVTLGLWRGSSGERCQYLFLDHPGYYARPGLYGEAGADYHDNARRFALLSIGALTAAQLAGFHPDIVHANDWQTGLAPLALRRGFAHSPLAKAKSLFTIHNLAYQGVFPKGVLRELGMPWELFTLDGVEFYDQVSFLKAALVYSDALTTVSPRYAWEITTPEAGWGMDALLRRRSPVMTGILNGIDTAEWNPQTDPHLAAHFSADDLSGKRACKRALLEELGMTSAAAEAEAEARPLFAFVGRLTEQKGVRLMLEALPWLLEQGANVVVVGTGDPNDEAALSQLAARWPGRMAARIVFDPPLSHRVEAGADFFMMPSLFEPCGLNQMYSLRYGTVPIVRAVGGLRDTVTDLSQEEGTGLLFDDFHPEALRGALWRALELYRHQPQSLDSIRKRGMQHDFSWDASARRYVKLYESMLAGT